MQYVDCSTPALIPTQPMNTVRERCWYSIRKSFSNVADVLTACPEQASDLAKDLAELL